MTSKASITDILLDLQTLEYRIGTTIKKVKELMEKEGEIK
jgi:hypothetical protein